nr:polysaccharide biosynthesis tyrosine autokinase [uncultured Rhodopila sp.]
MASTAAEEFDLRQFINFFWRKWKFIASVTVAVLIVVIMFLATATPRYTASAELLLDPNVDKTPGTESLFNALTLDQTVVDSQVAVMRSNILLQRVVKSQKLVADPEFGVGPDTGRTVFARVQQAITGFFAEDAAKSQISAKDEIFPPDVLAAIARLRAAFAVERVGRTYVIKVSITSVDRFKAARLANAVADAFIVDKLEARFASAQRATTWLGDHLEQLRTQLRDSEQAVADFRSEHGLITTGKDITLNEEQLSELNAKLVTARADAAEKKAKYDQVLALRSNGGDVQALPDVLRSTVISQLRAQEADVSRREADLIARYSDRHPSVVNVRAERRDIERALGAEVTRIAANLKSEYDVARAGADALQASLAQVSGASSADGRVTVGLRELERTAFVNKTLFEDFLSRAKISEERSTFEVREARLITQATPPSAPSFPPKALTIAIGLVAGLLLGSGGAVATEMLRQGFTTPREVEERLDLPVLGSIKRLSASELTVERSTLTLARFLVAKPMSRFAEAIRLVRTGIQMADVDNIPRVIQVTSAIPNEGKTTISLALAFSAAATSSQKVALVEGDFRHASLTRFFGLEKSKGVVDLLLGTETIETITHVDEATGVHVFVGGSKTQNPPDLLGSERMRDFIETLRSRYDYIVLDTPPVGPVADAIVASALADKVVFIIHWGRTAREVVSDSIRLLLGDKKVAGVVLNLVNESEARKYGRYAYSYYYGRRYYKSYYAE